MNGAFSHNLFSRFNDDLSQPTCDFEQSWFGVPPSGGVGSLTRSACLSAWRVCRSRRPVPAKIEIHTTFIPLLYHFALSPASPLRVCCSIVVLGGAPKPARADADAPRNKHGALISFRGAPASRRLCPASRRTVPPIAGALHVTENIRVQSPRPMLGLKSAVGDASRRRRSLYG
jgi:hypothetical protein